MENQNLQYEAYAAAWHARRDERLNAAKEAVKLLSENEQRELACGILGHHAYWDCYRDQPGKQCLCGKVTYCGKYGRCTGECTC